MLYFDQYNNFNYFVNRVKPYNPIGRFQTEEESDKLSIQIKKTFADLGYNMKDIAGDESGYDSVVQDILVALENSSLKKE